MTSVIRFDDDTLSLRNTRSLRFAMAVLIVVYHSSYAFESYAISRVGYIFVALFFFLSGYGLHEGVKNKKGYLRTFLPKRYPSLLIPYFICGIISVLITAVAFVQYSNLPAMLIRVFEFPFVYPVTWYVAELVVFYALFFVTFVFLRGRTAVAVLSILATIAAWILAAHYDRIVFSLSFVGFILGLVWSCHSEKIVSVLKRFFVPVFIILTAVLLIPFGTGYGWWADNMFVPGIRCSAFVIMIIMLRMLNLRKNLPVFVSVAVCFSAYLLWGWESAGTDWVHHAAPQLLFVVIVIVLLTKIPLTDDIMSKWGISYELYLLHWTILVIIYAHLWVGNVFIGTVLGIVLSIAVAAGAHLLSYFVLRRYDRAFERLEKEYHPQ
ncbi:MAG: acyltransferase family protein [Methanomassiliicoccaceae archaeon]|nr:acyltransferase family protein [Methanomassiliicoccaceae archaeon]